MSWSILSRSIGQTLIARGEHGLQLCACRSTSTIGSDERDQYPPDLIVLGEISFFRNGDLQAAVNLRQRNHYGFYQTASRGCSPRRDYV